MKDKNKLNAGYGFNRYMVECEFLDGVCLCLLCCRFNRYMVECECLLSFSSIREHLSF